MLGYDDQDFSSAFLVVLWDKDGRKYKMDSMEEEISTGALVDFIEVS